MAHITVNGKPLCTFGITAVNTRNHGCLDVPYSSICCGWATLAWAEAAVEILRRLNPDRKPGAFGAHEESCPTWQEELDADSARYDEEENYGKL